ncbi:malate dehydrogenase (quinone) [Micrococcales bacterium 31B]|nr:malate dehydrogenase (quinone) [Micrococcales bacterium 31B]
MTGDAQPTQHPDAILIGGGIINATLATMLRIAEPDWNIVVLERLTDVGLESSDAWNNAGTGHSALCELNYTPRGADGTVNISKAESVAEGFFVSRQFWSSLVDKGWLRDPAQFISAVPHCSLTFGEDGVQFLKERHAALERHPLFQGMQFSSDHEQIKQWIPLVTENRDAAQPMAATFSSAGTDVNFGALTRQMFAGLGDSLDLRTGVAVTKLKRLANGRWGVMVRDENTRAKSVLTAPFVFVGAGGGSLPLLQKSGIPEAKGYGGFPVSGQFLRCTNPDIIAKHSSKVYGQPAVGAPPMSDPHLDTRVIDGEKALLFGPYAGFSPKFLKTGSLLDLPLSVLPNNLKSMLGVGANNMPLTQYLIKQVAQSHADRVQALRKFIPDARDEDWELLHAGQRVQVIAPDQRKGGVLQFGTQIISAADGSLAGLLGASPGASVAAKAMLDVLQDCFGDRFEQWAPALREFIPHLGASLAQDHAAAAEVVAHSERSLGLTA